MTELFLTILGVLFQLFAMNLWAEAFPPAQKSENIFRTVALNFIAGAILVFSNLYFIDPFFQIFTIFLCALIIFLNKAPFNFTMLFSDFIFCVCFICGKAVGKLSFAMSLKDTGIPFLTGPCGLIPGLIANLTMLILSWIGYSFFKRNKMAAEGTVKNFAVLLILPVSSLFILFGLASASRAAGFLTLIGSLGLAASNILSIIYFEKNAALEEQRIKAAFLEKQIGIQKSYYLQREENQLEVMKIRHNLKNTLLALLGYAKAKDIEAIEQYLTAAGEALKLMDGQNTVCTGHAALDSILSEKKSMAEEKQIEVKMNLDLSAGRLWIDEMELCIILSNALDNAIEACEKITDSQKRIVLSLKLSEKSVKILLTNTVDETLYRGRLDLRTSKKNKKTHGFGLQTMAQITQKYNGLMNTDVEKGCFRLTIILFR